MSDLPRGRHSPVRHDAYVRVHDTRMAKLRARGFVGEDTLRWKMLPTEVLLSGEIACRGGIVVAVGKTLDYDGVQVQTREYA